jgi:hypothetical protein
MGSCDIAQAVLELTMYVAQAGLKLVIFPPQSPGQGNYKHVPPHPARYVPFFFCGGTEFELKITC